jgi:polynucleotide 5'-hydroxyl-kinase GRC3/NOL9
MFMDPSCLSALAQDQVHVPDDWAEAAARVIAAGVCRALVLGSADTGKSTFCRFLVGEARRAGRTVALLDADVGQKTVGPPACVTLAEAAGARLAFVGATSPIDGWRRVLDGVRNLASAADAALLIANTSGILVGPGRRLKAAKIAVIRPDLLIALGSGADIELALRDHGGHTAIRLSRSPQARHKTKVERRAARREAFRRYFAGASLRTFDRSALDGGQEYPAGLLLGLGARDGDIGLGILVGCPTSVTITVLTPVSHANIARLEPGLLCLDRNFREIPAPVIRSRATS